MKFDQWTAIDRVVDNMLNKIELAIAKAADIKRNTGVELTWQEVMPHIQMMGPNPMPVPDKEAAPKLPNEAAPDQTTIINPAP